MLGGFWLAALIWIINQKHFVCILQLKKAKKWTKNVVSSFLKIPRCSNSFNVVDSNNDNSDNKMEVCSSKYNSESWWCNCWNFCSKETSAAQGDFKKSDMVMVFFEEAWVVDLSVPLLGLNIFSDCTKNIIVRFLEISLYWKSKGNL